MRLSTTMALPALMIPMSSFDPEGSLSPRVARALEAIAVLIDAPKAEGGETGTGTGTGTDGPAR